MGLIPILGISSIISLDIMADATEKGASKEAPFFIAARKRGFFRAQRARGVYAARKGCSFFAPIGRRGFNRSAVALHPFSRASAGGGAACAPRHQRGYSLFEENAPFESPRERRGASPPRPPTLPVWGLKNCSACGIGCGVHGFAMNLLRVATSCNRALLS